MRRRIGVKIDFGKPTEQCREANDKRVGVRRGCHI
jgi:hypothetical protein